MWGGRWAHMQTWENLVHQLMGLGQRQELEESLYASTLAALAEVGQERASQAGMLQTGVFV